jgi:ATP-binding cassette subfamily F protein 3
MNLCCGLLADEPTNHLDMNAIEALINAIQQFHGGVMVISHDQHFITSVCNEIWAVGKFGGDFIRIRDRLVNCC